MNKRTPKTSILFIIDNLQFGGGERVFSQIINGLNSDQYNIYLVSGSNERFLSAIHNPQVRYHTLDFSKRFNPVSIFKIAKIIKNNRIQIVHSQGARAEFHTRIAKRIAGNPFYISTIAMPVEGFDVGFLRGKAYRLIDYFSERYVDRFIVVSDALREMLIQKRNISGNKVIRIFNGIELDHFTPHPEQSSLRNQLNIPKDSYLIGAIGRMVWQKGFEYLIRAVADLIETVPNIKLLVVGEGPIRHHLIQLIDKLNLNKCVIFLEFQRDVKQVLSAIDVLVVPSLLEGFPMIILEAMAMSKPIIATKINGITEQLVDGESGILVPPKDLEALVTAIQHLVENDRLRYRLGQNARKRVDKEFSIEKMIGETVNVYQSLMETSLGKG